jgi:hypothetical protein
MITTPLLLNVVALTYQGKTIKDLAPLGTAEEQQRQIFANYVKRMLQLWDAKHSSTSGKALHWLTWLAQQLKQRGQSVFYIEDIQKDWLPDEKTYHWSLSIVFAGIVPFFLSLLYIAALVSHPMPQRIIISLYVGAFHAGIIFLLYGCIFPYFSIKHPHKPMPNRTQPFLIKRHISILLNNHIFYGLFVGISHGLFLQQFLFWRPYAILHGICVAIAYVLVGRFDRDVQPVAIIAWSWRGIWKGLLNGLLLGLLFSVLVSGLALSLIDQTYRFLHHQTILISDLLLTPLDIVSILLFGTIIGSGFGIIFSLVAGVAYKIPDKSEQLIPNQGIRRSVRNSLLLGSISVLLVSLVATLTFGPMRTWAIRLVSALSNDPTSFSAPWDIAWSWGIGIGIAAALVISLRNGGVASIQHMLLRFLLWRRHCIPWHYPRFLDEASDNILLKKIGGGYSFVHPILQDYFASLGTTPTSNTSLPPTPTMQ